MTLCLSVTEYAQLLGNKPRKSAPSKQRSQVSKLAADTRLQLAGLPAWVTEHKFHPVRKWRLDYAWPAQKIALEVHGGVHSGGRHTRGDGFTGDREKMNEAAAMGWIVIEATAAQIRNGQARAWLQQVFNNRGVTHD